MPSTLVVLAAAFAVPFLVGLPLAWLCAGRKPLTPGDWLAAPFLGLAAAVVPLLNFVYLDVPVRRSAPWFWLAVLGLYAFWIARGGLLASLRTVPSRLLLACLAAYLAQAGGFIYQGVGEYLGRARGDQVNYNSLAQFVAERPYSTSLGDDPREPWEFPALALKDDRLGQSVAQALLLVTTGRDAAAVYFPLAALGPALLVLALGSLGRTLGLPERLAAAAALGAALLPGVTQIMLEYLSHVLALPLLYFLIVCLHRLTRSPTPGRSAQLALALACAAAVYPEFLPIYLGTFAVWACCSLLSGQASRRSALAWAAAAAALPLLLPLALGSFLTPLSRLGLGHDAQVYAPLTAELPLVAWRGEVPAYVARWRAWNAALSLLCALGVAGVMLAALRSLRKGGRRAAFAPAVALLAIAALPLAAWLVDRSRSYQVYKLALTACPATALGLAWLARWKTPRLGGVAAMGLILLPAWGTLLIQREAVLNELPGRSTASLCRDEVARPARRLLAGPESAWILSLGERREDAERAAWLCWYGRSQRLWLAPAKLHGMAVDAYRPGLYSDVETAPDEVNYLCGGRGGVRVLSPGLAHREEDEGVTRWRLHEGRWCVPLRLLDERGEDLLKRGWRQPAGRPWALEVYARCEGEVRVNACWDGDRGRRASLCVAAGGLGAWRLASPGDVTASARVPKGRHVIHFTLLPQSPGDPPLRGAFPLGDVEFEFVPGP
jgi:hypothetical protein